MLLRKRGAIELSITFLVIVLMSLALLGTGTYLLFSFQKSGKELYQQAEAKSAAAASELEKPLQEKRVTLSPLQVQLKAGGRQQFTVAIQNIIDHEESFRVEVLLGEALTDTGELLFSPQEQAQFLLRQWAFFDHDFFALDALHQTSRSILLLVPEKTLSGSYSFEVRVFNAKAEQYGQTQKFTVLVQREDLVKEQTSSEKQESLERAGTDCTEDLSCEAYFIFVPLHDWPADELFAIKAQERGKFFQDISEFKFKKTGMVVMPLQFAAGCDLKKVNKDRPQDHLRIKKCADAYADSLGIQYTRAVGLSSTFDAGKAYFKEKSLYTSLGYQKGRAQSERPGIVAHEIGHTYNLCDEYSFETYQTQNRYFANNPCKNAFPSTCSAASDQCLGNTPSLRDYEGEPLLGVCSGDKHYSVMGFSTGAECGFDATGGYHAIH